MDAFEEEVASVTMVAAESFGARLKRMLDKREMRGADLAKGLSTHRTLVSRWLTDERIPALNSGHVERIAQYLELTPRERTDLRDAQVESLRVARSRPSTGGGRGRRSDGPRTQLPQSTRIIRDLTSLHTTMLQVLEGLEAPTAAGDSILFTMQASATSDTVEPAIYKRYPQALRRALRLGWTVRELWRLDSDTARAAILVAHLLDLVGEGRYEPRYSTRYDTLGSPSELVVVPDQAAFILFSTRSMRSVDTALHVAERDGVAALRDRFELLARQTEPLYERYPIARRTAFGHVLAGAEEMPGGRMLVKYGLSVYTEPEDWSREDSHWARRMARMGADKGAMIAAHIRRQEAFRRNVRLFPYRDICPISAVRQLVTEGAYVRDDVPSAYDAADPAVRVAHLRNTIAVLERYDNYQLALIDDAEAARFGIRPETYWAAVGGSRAMVNVRAPDERGQPTDADLDITEPTIAAGFASHFDSIWARIAPRNRDKAHIAGWLRQQLVQIEAQ